MAAEEKMAKIALKVKPDLVTLVPERRQELTTEGGLAVAQQRENDEQRLDDVVLRDPAGRRLIGTVLLYFMATSLIVAMSRFRPTSIVRT